MNCLFGGDFKNHFFAMSINRCMQCGCKSSLDSDMYEKITHFSFFSACVMLVHRCEPTKPHEHSAGYSFMACFFLTHFGCSLLISFWFQLTFLRTYSFPSNPKSVWRRPMNICVSTSTHYPMYVPSHMKDIWDVCKLQSGQLNITL